MADPGTAQHDAADQLVALCGPAVAESAAALIQDWFAEGQASWPEIVLSIADYTAAVAKRVADPANRDSWTTLCGTDLYLATACGLGDPRALAAFESDYAGELRILAARFGLNPPARDEVVQKIRAKLFTGEQPLIRSYAGTGALRSWFRVTALRTFLDHQRQHRRDRLTPVTDDYLTDLMADDGDAELRYIKDRYRALVHEAISAAVAALSPQQRILLNQHYIYGVTLDELAKLYGAHRVTIARRVAKCREAILGATKEKIQTRLGTKTEEFESLIRLVGSGLEVSLGRILAAKEPQTAGDDR